MSVKMIPIDEQHKKPHRLKRAPKQSTGALGGGAQEKGGLNCSTKHTDTKLGGMHANIQQRTRRRHAHSKRHKQTEETEREQNRAYDMARAHLLSPMFPALLAISKRVK
jgi:hypothetical protein